MQVGEFYFIKDEYFTDNLKEDGQRNKRPDSDGKPHNRPYFCFAIDGDIKWMVPVSSQIPKYKRLYKSKTENGKVCDTIHFAYVKGNENAVLIQDMIPVTDKYIKNQYMMPNGTTPVSVSEKAKKAIVAKARKVMRITKSGKKLTFIPIVELENKLRNSS